MVKVAAVILAAGMSQRMGKSKPLLHVKGEPMIHYPIKLAIENKLEPIVIVGGEYLNKIQEVASCFHAITYRFNPDYSSGMASSLKLGIQEVTGKCDATIIFLADQPFTPLEVVMTLMEEYKQNRDKGIRIVRPRYNGHPGHPIIFDADLFQQFDSIKGDEGGRSIIESHRHEMRMVDFTNAQWGIDIDTPEDYEKMKE